MTLMDFLQAAFMGLVEAVTEFIPVSSTGHLILAGKIIGFEGPLADVFEVVIQLGAILAICALYFKRLLNVVLGLGHDAGARHFAIVSIIAVIPAFIAGALLHDIIKTVLFSPLVVCVSMVVGGFAILFVERSKPAARFAEIETMPYTTGLKIGLVQCLALIPGVSRSGATIMGALWLGVERKTAAEFSFFQAIPIMLGASVLDLWKNRHDIDASGAGIIAVGFVTSFVGALFVVRWMMQFVGRHGFAPFAYYRIVAGIIGLGILLFMP